MSEADVYRIRTAIWQPVEKFNKYRAASSMEEINPNYITPKQGLIRLQKIMDEFGGGASMSYTTNAPTLARGIELIEMLRQDIAHLAARNRHELKRCWELVH